MSETLSEARRRFARLTSVDRVERMVTEISLGISKSRSHAITTNEDSILWDGLVRDIDEIKAKGGTIDYGYTDKE
jgi:hypothetical protein